MVRISPSSKPKTRLIYILAASHSGSTLLASLLANHPEICTVGELNATALGEILHYRCSCRAPIEQCRFWRGINEDMASRGFPFTIVNAGTDFREGASAYVQALLRPLHRGAVLEGIRDMALTLSPWWRKQLPLVQARNAALAACLCTHTGTHVIVDSSKIGFRLKYLLRNQALNVKVVRLIRDGRGVALTYTDPANFADAKELDLRGGGMGGNRERERLSLTDAVWEWRRSNEEADAILSRLSKDRWTEVRYETLCAEPAATLERLFQFIGVDVSLGLMPQRSAEHHIIGNGMRFDTTREAVLDDRWKSTLNAGELQTFDSIAGQVSRRLGYA